MEGLARVRVDRGGGVEDDWVAVEAPLEIHLDGEPLLVTMRTPETTGSWRRASSLPRGSSMAATSWRRSSPAATPWPTTPTI